jgi:hypothetical protein
VSFGSILTLLNMLMGEASFFLLKTDDSDQPLANNPSRSTGSK